MDAGHCEDFDDGYVDVAVDNASGAIAWVKIDGG